MIPIQEMNAKHLDILISEYNWDDGFRVPQMVIDNKNCELGTALKTFYLADGYSYLLQNNIESSEWFQFVLCLYKRILDESFYKGDLSYSIPLTKTQIYKLKRLMYLIYLLLIFDLNNYNIGR